MVITGRLLSRRPRPSHCPTSRFFWIPSGICGGKVSGD